MSYIGVPPFGQTVRTPTELVATAGQTAFNIAGGYIPGYVDVYLNGALLSSSEFTATDGYTVTLAVAAAVGDEFKAMAYWPVSLMDVYRKGEADALLAGKVGLTGNETIAGNKTFSGYTSIRALLEQATITASAPAATTAFDAITQAVQYYTTDATANFTLNVRGDASTSINSMLAIGQSLTIALLVTNGATAYRPSTFQVDGTTITPKWLGGSAPTGGNANSIDSYSYTIIKTANATFTVLASQNKFA